MATVTNIKVSDVGPIHELTLPLLPDGGIVVVTGRNGKGKDHAIRAVSGDNTLEARDGTKRGVVDFGGATIKIGKRTTRTGEIPVETAPENFTLDDLISPQGKTVETRDMTRLKALVTLAGKSLDVVDFQALDEGGEGAEILKPEDADTDAVKMASKCKRRYEAQARHVENQATTERNRYESAKSAYEGIDLEAEHDRQVLQKQHEAAVSLRSSLRERKRAADQHAEAQQQARAKLADAKSSYQGPTVQEALDRLDDAKSLQKTAESGRNEAQAEVDRLQKMLDEAKEVRDQAVAKLNDRTTTVQQAENELTAARKHLDDMGGWEEALNSAAPKPPSAAELEEADVAVATAEAALELGVAVRTAILKQREAEQHLKEAQALEKRADQLRDAAKACEEVLSEAIGVSRFQWRGANLWYVDESGEEELYDRLSEGQRYKVGIEVVAGRLHEVSGGGIPILPLKQVGWEGIDVFERQKIHATAKANRVVIFTGQATRDLAEDGELKATVYEP